MKKVNRTKIALLQESELAQAAASAGYLMASGFIDPPPPAPGPNPAPYSGDITS